MGLDSPDFTPPFAKCVTLVPLADLDSLISYKIK